MFKKLLPSIVWAIGILFLIGMPGTYFPKVVSFLEWASPDKIVHFILFGGQTFLILLAFREQYLNRRYRLAIVILAIGIGIVYGLLTEVLQRYVFVGRDGNYFDFIADVVGALIGFLAFHMLFRKKVAKT